MGDIYDIAANIGTIIGVLVAIVIAAYTVKNDKKNLKLHGLDLVFQKFNNPEARASRIKILNAYSNYLNKNNFKSDFTTFDFHQHTKIDLTTLNPQLNKHVIKVKSDFEQIAVMEKNGMIDENAYFDAYWGMMLRCYATLHGNIEQTRIKTKTKHYTKYFEEQCERAIHYWRQHHDQDHVFYYNDNSEDLKT